MTNNLIVKIYKDDEVSYEPLQSYCARLSKRNNSILYQLETYLNVKLLNGNPELAEIRETILNVSGEISKLSERLIVGDENERL